MDISLNFSGYIPLLNFSLPNGKNYILTQINGDNECFVTWKMNEDKGGTKLKKYDDDVSVVDKFIIEALNTENIPYAIYNENGIYINGESYYINQDYGLNGKTIISPILNIDLLPQYLYEGLPREYYKIIKILIDLGLYKLIEDGAGFILIPPEGFDGMNTNQILAHISTDGIETIYGIVPEDFEILRSSTVGPVKFMEIDGIINVKGPPDIPVEVFYTKQDTLSKCDTLNDIMGIFSHIKMKYKNAGSCACKNLERPIIKYYI